MTDQENKEQKLKTKNALLSNKLISEVLPSVKEIKIEYIAEHNSAFGKKVVENIIIRTPQSKDFPILLVFPTTKDYSLHVISLIVLDSSKPLAFVNKAHLT